MNRARYRMLLVLTTLISIVAGIISWFGDSLLPGELQLFIHRPPASLVSARTALAMGVVGLGLGIVAIVGLFFFWKPARVLTLLLWAVGFVVTPLMGPTVELGWVTALNELSAVLSGVIIALVFFSPISVLFERHGGNGRMSVERET